MSSIDSYLVMSVYLLIAMLNQSEELTENYECPANIAIKYAKQM